MRDFFVRFLLRTPGLGPWLMRRWIRKRFPLFAGFDAGRSLFDKPASRLQRTCLECGQDCTDDPAGHARSHGHPAARVVLCVHCGIRPVPARPPFLCHDCADCKRCRLGVAHGSPQV